MDTPSILWANAQALEFWGANSVAELRQRDVTAEMSETVRVRLAQLRKELRSGKSVTELWTFYPKGQPRSLQVVFSGVELEDGRLAMLNEGIRDIEGNPDTLRSLHALLHTTVMITLYSRDGRILYGNPASRLTHAVEDANWRTRFVEPSEYQRVQEGLETDGHIRTIVEVNARRERAWHELDARLSHDAVSGESVVLVTETNVTDLFNAEARAAHLAHYDALTGLPNRQFLDEWFEARTDSDLQFALLFIDLDHFKIINDSLGHPVGDELLIAVARRLQNSVRPTDHVVRLGGDEFVVLLDRISRLSVAQQAAEKLGDAISQSYYLANQRLQVTASIGVCVSGQPAESVATLMKKADLAMYSAKEKGRARYAVFSAEMESNANLRHDIVSGLRRALKDDELVVFFQPRALLSDRTTVGAEALVRWNHPERGLLFPESFVPLAEQSGLIEEIDLWVLSVATKQQRRWAQKGINCQVSVNISPASFSNANLAEAICSVVRDAGGDASMMELELTESVLIGDDESRLLSLRKLAEFGFRLAIDDFGTGFSNLAYLQRYPITTLKVDAAFVRNRDQRPIAEVILSMSRMLNLRSVAEGIEDEDALDWASDRAFDEFQGFVLAKALSPADFEVLLESASVKRPDGT